MGPKTTELIATLSDLERLLFDVNEKNWGRWAAKARELLMNSDAHGLEVLLAGSGGLGSFNDLVISHLNGHAIERSKEALVNDQISKLSARAFSLGREIQREAEG